MKNVKYKLIDTQLYDYSLIEEKLTRLAAEGWHLEKLGTLAWKFRRGEPKQVRYAVTYAPSASAFNSRPTAAEEDLSDLCAQAGWVRIANQAQLHVYRNEDPGAVPLETDENERLKTIRKSMKKHFFPTELLMIAIFLMQFFMHLSTMIRSPGRTLSSPMMVTTLGMCLFVALIHGVLAVNGLLWLRRAQRCVDEGEAVPVNRFYRRFRWVIWAFLILYLLCLLWTVGLGFLAWVLLTSAAVLFVTAGGVALCKRLNAPRWVNMVVPAGLCALVVAILIPVLIFGVDRYIETDQQELAEYIPLTLTALTGETNTERYIQEEHSSFLCAYGRYWDTFGDEVRLSYTIVDVKCPLFYDALLNEQEQQLQVYSHYGIDAEVAELAERFGAEYARHAGSTLGDRWLICWDSRIVYLKASWELTEEQLDILADTLKP